MKKLITLTYASIMCLSLQAQYKILQINTPTVTISGKELRKGDVFNDPAVIDWINDRQAMKVLDVKTKSQKVIIAGEYKKSNANSITSFFIGKKNLSSRDGADNLVTLKQKMTGEFFLQDTLSFNTTYSTNDRQFFFVSYMYNGEEINKRVENRDGTFFITSDIFSIDGVRHTPFDTILSVYYLDQNSDQLTLITDCMEIKVIWEFLDN